MNTAVGANSQHSSIASITYVISAKPDILSPLCGNSPFKYNTFWKASARIGKLITNC